MNQQPIGIFDSGVGGLSVWQTTVRLLPHESVIYLADTRNCPYGPQPVEAIIGHCQRNVEFLLSKNCKLIVVACNTATAAAIEVLRQTYEIPFVGMEPAVKPAAMFSKTGKIGVLATQGTLNGQLFKNTSEKYARHLEVFVQIGHGLVELVENGKTDSEEAIVMLRKYVEPMLRQQVDQIVLGCTHYPFLIGAIKKITGDSVSIVNPAEAVSRQTKRLLDQKNLLSTTNNQPYYQFYANGDARVMHKMVGQIITENSINANFEVFSTHI